MSSLSINSAIEGLVWPGVPAANGAALLAILFQLEQTQWWQPEMIDARQCEQLQALIRHARQNVFFYSARLSHVPDTASSAEEWREAWRTIPPLLRDEIQAVDADDGLITRRLPAGHGELREIYTSGSTGRPIRSIRTQLWELIWSAFTVRDHLWHRRDLTGKMATIRESAKGKALYPHGAVAESWGYSSATVFRTGKTVSLNVATPLSQQAEWLAREDPDYLITHPSLANDLALHCIEHGVRLPRLQQIITIAENLRPKTRALCNQAWNVPLVDIYSTRETGYLALQCPEHEHYHVQSEGVFLEVVDDQGHPCQAGEVGRALVTVLHNFAMPLIRYDIGDQVELGGPCPCGRGLPVISRIMGRRQNMLMMPSGERRWPLLSSADIEAMLGAAPSIRQYQLAQKASDSIELRLCVAKPLTAVEEAALIDWVRTKFNFAFRVSFAYFDELPRNSGGKLEDFVNEIESKPR